MDIENCQVFTFVVSQLLDIIEGLLPQSDLPTLIRVNASLNVELSEFNISDVNGNYGLEIFPDFIKKDLSG